MANYAVTAVKTLTKPDPKAIQAGEALSQFDIIYVDTTTQKGFQAINSNANKLNVAYICLTAAALDEYAICLPLSSGVELEVTLSSGTFTVPERIILSATAGKMAPLADLASSQYLVEIAYATTTSRIKLDKNNTGVTKP